MPSQIKKFTIFISLVSSLLFFKFSLAEEIVFNNFFETNTDSASLLNSIMNYALSVVGILAVLALAIAGTLYILGSIGNKAFIDSAKKISTGAVIGLIMVGIGPTFITEIKNDIPSEATLAQIASNMLTTVLSVFGIIAIIGLVVSGIFFIGGETFGTTDRAKEGLKYSIIGIIVAGGSLILVNFIAGILAPTASM